MRRLFCKREINALMEGQEGCKCTHLKLKLDHHVYDRVRDGCDRATLQDRYFKNDEDFYVSHSVVKVKLSEKALNVISNVAARVVSESRGYMNESNFRAGLIGQCAAALFIFQDWRKGLESVEYGKPDSYDILLTNGQKSEVKTFRWSEFKDAPDSWMLVPLSQFERPEREYPYYIACQLISLDVIYILGFICRSKLERVGVKVGLTVNDKYLKPNMAVKLLDDLTPIKCLSRELRPMDVDPNA